jgi:hypothetical protein
VRDLRAVGRTVMAIARKAAVLIVFSLVMTLFLASPAHASGTDAAKEIADDTSNWFWCTAGYEEYCEY